MASVEERYNNILKNAQTRYDNIQSVNQRYNNIMNKVNNNKSYIERLEKQKQLQEQQKKEEEIKKQQQIQKLKEINEISKINSNNVALNKSKINLPNNSVNNIKLSLYNPEEIEQQINDKKQEKVNNVSKEILLPDGRTWKTNNSKAIQLPDGRIWYTNVNDEKLDNSVSGKLWRNVKSISSSLYTGVQSGVANYLDDAINTTKWIDKKYQDSGIIGKTVLSMVDPGVNSRSISNKLYSDKLKEKEQTSVNEIQDTFKFVKEKNEEKHIENVENATNKVTKKITELAPSVGNSLFGAGLSAIHPAIGTSYFIGSASGSYHDEAINKGMNEDQAFAYSKIMGTLEGTTEEIITGQNIKGLKKILEGEGFKNVIKSFGIEIGENFLQEAVMEPLSEGATYITAGKEYMKYDLSTKKGVENLLIDSWQSGVDGALSSILSGGTSRGVASAVRVTNKIVNGQKPTQQEIIEAIQDSAHAGVDIQGELQKSLLQSAEKKIIQSQNDNNISNIEQNPTQTPNNVQNLQQNAVKNQSNVQQQQISQIDNKMSLNQNVEHQNNYITSAQKYNINTNTQSVRKIGELADKRGINITYNDSLFKNNPNANAIYQTTTDKDGNVTRNIILNPNMNTNRTLEQIELHEIVHDMYGTEKFNKLKEMVLAYDKSKAGYQEARAELEQLYSQVYDKNSADFQNLIDEEAVADILGNRLGDQEFVNSLVNMKESRSIARKIYDWVVEKLNNMTRSFENMNQYFYWKDVKNKFEEAFRQEYKGNNNSIMYSIETDSNGRKYIKVDTDQNIFEGIEPKDYTQIAKMYMQDYLKGETKLGEDATTRIGNKGISKYTNPKQQTKYINEKMQLTPELKNVLQIAEKVKSGLPTKDTSKYPSWEYYKFNFELGGKTFEGLINIGIDKNGNKHFYEINKIHTTSNSYVSTSKSSSTDFINNSVAQNEQNVNNDTTAQYSMQESENNSGSFNLPKNHKQQQLEIIKKHNPMNDDYHTGIRNIEDIKTLEETLKDSDWADYDEFNPDLTKQDINKAIEAGKITVYSSYPIEQGVFVSPSKMEAETYSENGKVYSKEINIEDVAWIDPTQGQYARVENIKEETKLNLPKTDNQGRILTKEQQEYFKASKVRDEKGSLMIMYHGTNNDFTVFDKSLSDEDNVLGQGLYFTADSEQSLEYGEKQYEVYLNIKNPLIIEDLTTQALANKINSIDNNADIMDYDYGVASTEKMTNYLIKNGYDGIKAGDNVYVAFESNQVKRVNNTNPTDNPDIRYSTNSTNAWQQRLDTLYKNNNKGTKLQDIKLPKKENASKQKTSNAQEQVSANIKYKDTTTKVRKHYKSIIDSPYTSDEARAIAKELMGLDTYIPESNTKQLEEADRRISISGADSELDSLLARATVGGNIKADDIAVGERLIQYYSKTGNKTKLRDAIQVTAMAGTTAGQTVQAMSLLNHQTPEGHAVWLQRSVEKMNNDLKKSRGAKAEQFTLTEDMLDKIVNSVNTEELNKNLEEVYKELGQQVTKSTIQKIDAWRYFAMLANPKTHIRNVMGNTAMHAVQYGVKNKVAGVIEGVVSKFNKNMERTHTIALASKEVKAFAKSDIVNVADRLGLNENKYNPKSRLENNMRTFKSNTMEKTVGKAFEINNKLLEAEDGFGLKAGYTKALAEYMTANKLTPNNITDKQLAKARNYAIQQAQEATFHQNSQLATLINQLSNKNRFAKFMVDAILPFKKTPINIAKTGVQYSPIGLAKNMVYDTVQLRKGNITANQYIDNISKGLTGTGIALVGFALASMGILKASGSSDDDKEKYDQSRGSQTYSVQIGDNTYSLDWLAPTAIPLFIGAECFELMEESRETKSSTSTDDDKLYNQVIKSAVNVLDSFTNAMNPMTEMSMLSGLSSSLKSYEQGSSQVLSTFGTNAVKSYVNQFVPTALGQIAKTTDEYERSTTSTKTGVLPKAVDTTKNQIMSKIPGLRQMLPVKTDIWGNELKQNDNMVLRALENSTFPWTRKEVANSKVDIELSKLYENTGESSVLPDTLDKTFTINKQKYRLTNEEYAKYKNRYGRTSYKLLRELVTTSDYKNMTTTQKQKAVENVYSYAKEINKIDYANNNDLEVETSILYDTLEAIGKVNGDKSDYITYLSKTYDINGEGSEKKKINILANSGYNLTTKKAIYENSIGKDDELYSIVMKNTGINMTEYLKYKSQTFSADKKDDGTVDGKSISGSKKQKVYAYVNNMKITGNQRMLLLGTQYKLTNSERQVVAQYVKSLNITNKEKLAIYDKLQGFTVYKDGRVTF